MNTFQLVEEMLVNQRKGVKINTHEDRTSCNLAYDLLLLLL
jgi:hypothetical protein